MRLRERDPDPEARRELEAIDAALRGERVDPELDELAALATALREARPPIPPAFAAELDERAAAGFPAGEGAPGRVAAARGRAPRRFRLGLVAAPVAAAVIGVAVLANVLGGGSDDPSLPAGGSTEAVEEGSAGRDAAAQPQSAPAAGAEIVPGPTAPSPLPSDEPLKPGRERVQERSVSTTLSTEPGEVDDVADRVVEVTERYEGIVVSSSVSTADDRGRATFDLRVPSRSLQAFLSDLSDLASVSERSEGTLDITAPFVSASERFDDAKAEVDSLLAQLAEASSTAEIDAVRERLALARGELAAARAELAGLKRRAELSTVSVTVVGDGDADGWSLGDAADDARNVLEDILGAGLVALAAIVPLGAVALLTGYGVGRLRRRGRERALDRG